MGAQAAQLGPLARQGNKRNETGCTTSLHEGSAAARNPTHRSPIALPGQAHVCVPSLPAHNLTTTPHAQLQVTGSCGPRGLCDPPSVTTTDKTFSAPAAAPLAAAYRKTQKEKRLPRCTTASGSSLILSSGMKDGEYAYIHGHTRGINAALHGARLAQ